MTNSIIVHNLDIEELKKLIKSTVKEQFDELKHSLSKDDPDELLTREETCGLLKIDPSTLWHWTKKGKVKCYGIGHRRYYKRNEIMECLIPKTI